MQAELNSEIDLSKEITNQQIRLYFNKIGEHPELPDVKLFNWLGLYNPNTGVTHPRLLERDLVQETFKSLIKNGTYTPQFIDVIKYQSLQLIGQKQEDRLKKQNKIRWARGVSYGGQIAIAVLDSAKNGWDNLEIPAISMSITFVLWQGIDRITTDSDYQRIAKAVLIDEALKRGFLETENRQKADPQKITEIALGTNEYDRSNIEIVSELQNLIPSLLDMGVSTIRLNRLLRKQLHTPFKKTVKEARQSIDENYRHQMNLLLSKYNKLIIQNAKDKDCTQESFVLEWKQYIKDRENNAIVKARNLRKDIASNII